MTEPFYDNYSITAILNTILEIIQDSDTTKETKETLALAARILLTKETPKK